MAQLAHKILIPIITLLVQDTDMKHIKACRRPVCSTAQCQWDQEILQA